MTNKHINMLLNINKPLSHLTKVKGKTKKRKKRKKENYKVLVSIMNSIPCLVGLQKMQLWKRV